MTSGTVQPEDQRPMDAAHARAREAVAHYAPAEPRALGILARIRLRLFAFMQRNSVRAVDLFLMPTDNFVDVGRRLEIGAPGDENRRTGQRGEADIDLKREPDGKQRSRLRRRGRGAVKL